MYKLTKISDQADSRHKSRHEEGFLIDIEKQRNIDRREFV